MNFAFLTRWRRPQLPAPDVLAEMIRRGALLLDVRSDAESQQDRVDGAVQFPHKLAARLLPQLEPNRERPIVVFCEVGARSGKVLRELRGLGYAQVVNGGNPECVRAALHLCRQS